MSKVRTVSEEGGGGGGGGGSLILLSISDLVQR